MKKKARSSKVREREGKEKAAAMAQEDPKEKARASEEEPKAKARAPEEEPKAKAPALASEADLDVELTIAIHDSKPKAAAATLEALKRMAPATPKGLPVDADMENTIATNELPLFEGRALASRGAAEDRDTEVEGHAPRVRVAKAYKMYVGGAFVRSESGRYVQTKAARGELGADAEVTNVPRGSRKDARDAVVAAKGAEAGWAARTAFNRGQILYRLAEVMESRREELVTSLVRGGIAELAAAIEVEAAVDRAVFYAGFADKYQALVASSNPVAGPHFGFSVPEPTGIIAVVAPERPALLGLVSTVLPVITTGNVVVAIAGEADPRTAVVFCECLATSDLPGGVVNVLTGQGSEIAPHLAKHREVFGFDAWTSDAALRALLEREGADNVKRVKTHEPPPSAFWLDERRGQGLGWLERFLETKTVWHPVGV